MFCQSCGVPIAGYDNEAFAGVHQVSKVGWTVPMRDAKALAKVIAELHQDREAIGEMAIQGRDFARQHCFEPTFAKRIAQIISASRLPQT